MRLSRLNFLQRQLLVATSLLLSLTLGSATAFANYSGAGDGTAQNPFIITNCSQLQEMQNIGTTGNGTPTSSYRIANDINCAGSTFTPITGTGTWAGNLDGELHTISNLTINLGANDKVGLFGYLDDASSIRNLIITGASITGNNHVGILAGIGEGTISGVSVSGVVQGGQNVGGLIGVSFDNAMIDQCRSLATVNGTSYVGGIAGVLGQALGGTLSNSYAAGAVVGQYAVGGLAGHFNGLGSQPLHIVNSYASGSVTGSTYAGGLIGDMYSAKITNSFATGAVVAANQPGGLVGINEPPNAGSSDPANLFNGCYFDSISTEQVSCSGTGNVGGCTGINTANYFRGNHANAPLSSWDFGAVWKTTASQLPDLQVFSNDVVLPTPTSTATRTPSPTPTATSTATPTGTLPHTPTSTATPNATATPTKTASPEITRTPTPTPQSTPTNTPTPRVTSTATPTPTGTRVYVTLNGSVGATKRDVIVYAFVAKGIRSYPNNPLDPFTSGVGIGSTLVAADGSYSFSVMSGRTYKLVPHASYMEFYPRYTVVAPEQRALVSIVPRPRPLIPSGCQSHSIASEIVTLDSLVQALYATALDAAQYLSNHAPQGDLRQRFPKLARGLLRAANSKFTSALKSSASLPTEIITCSSGVTRCSPKDLEGKLNSYQRKILSLFQRIKTTSKTMRSAQFNAPAAADAFDAQAELIKAQALQALYVLPATALECR